jgi:hypothetical protein
LRSNKRCGCGKNSGQQKKQKRQENGNVARQSGDFVSNKNLQRKPEVIKIEADIAETCRIPYRILIGSPPRHPTRLSSVDRDSVRRRARRWRVQ